MHATDNIDRPVFGTADVPMHRDDQGRLWFFPVDEKTFIDEVISERGWVDHKIGQRYAAEDIDTNTVLLILRDRLLETILNEWGIDWLEAIQENVADDLQRAYEALGRQVAAERAVAHRTREAARA